MAGTAYTIAYLGSALRLSPNYLLQQLQIGSFLSIGAAAMMIFILQRTGRCGLDRGRWSVGSKVEVLSSQRDVSFGSDSGHCST
jgi:hypothetical protein